MAMDRYPEVLAPAGDWERMETAVRFGADAVYLGGKMFGMRSSPENFDPDSLRRAVEYCHAREVRVYLTCNTLPTNREAEELPGFLAMAAEAGVDALIVADVGVLMCAKRVAPQVEVHISTQAGVVNYLTAGELCRMGAKRVVLARELSLEEIRIIREKTPPELELEAFVHGAMCMSFSGRCLISNYLVGRDANRGECAQPCRWGYHLMEEKRPGQYFPVFEDEKGSYILNAKDLCMLPYLDRLARAGVDSFKIEGRAKSAYYVAVITNAYRSAVDLYLNDPSAYELPKWLHEEVDKVSHRAYSTGFFFEEEMPGQYYDSAGYVREWDVVAVAESWQAGRLRCTGRNRFCEGDELEILCPGRRPIRLTVTELRDEEGEGIAVARHPMAVLQMRCKEPVPKGAILRKKALNQGDNPQ